MTGQRRLRHGRPLQATRDSRIGGSVGGWWLAGTLIAVLTAWLITFSGSPGLGDGPESVAGANEFGVLHAPGYILYSGLGWLTIRILGFLPAETAMSFLSVAASLGSVAVTYLLARRLGATKLGAAVAGTLLGLSGSVWFYSSYAKHTSLTTLLAAALIYLTVLLDDAATSRRALLAGSLLGASLGFGWPVLATVAPVSIWVCWRRGGLRSVGFLAVGTVVVGIGVAGLILWRSSQSPVVNWGGVDSIASLVDLVLMDDFGLLSAGESADLSTPVGGSRLSEQLSDVWGVLLVLARSLGIVTVGLASIALIAERTRRRLFLLLVASVNLLAVSLVLGIEDSSLDSVLIMGGFIGPGVVAVSGLAGVGASWLATRGDPMVRTVGLGLVVAAVVASAVGHRSTAAQPDEDLALIYASDMLNEVSDGGIVVTWFAERAFPLIYAQTIHGLRPDVTVVAGDGLSTDWYVEQISAQGLHAVDGQSLEETVTATVARWSSSATPVYLDIAAWLTLRDLIPSRIEGITAIAGTDSTSASAEASETVLALVGRPFMDDPLNQRWPNETVMSAYPRAAVILADFSLAAGDVDGARQLLDEALNMDPDNEVVRRVLNELPEGP